MNVEVQANPFDEDTLKSVISCAILMSSIDGEIDQREWDIIQSFANKHWKSDYRSFSKYQKKIKKEIEAVFNEREKFQLRLNELVENLTGNLNSIQKNEVLTLVGDVMIADGIMTLEESKLFATFMDKLGIRIA